MVAEIGINGVLIGTFTTSLFYLFSRFFIISNKVYKIKYMIYIKRILFYMLVSFLSLCVTLLICQNYLTESKMAFIVRAMCVGCLALLTTTMLLLHTREFWFIVNKFLSHNLRQKINKLSLSIICIGSILLFCLLFRFSGG